MDKCLFGEHTHAPVPEEHHHHDHHHHDHHHEHGHSHSHDHSHDYRTVDKKVLAVSLVITFAAMVLEIVFGIIAGSLALISDAVHMFTHTFALGVSYLAIVMANRQAPAAKTFGYHRIEVLAAFINALTIGMSVIWILYEAFDRFINPQPLEAGMSITVGVIGLVVNIATGLILMKGDMTNVNLRSAFFHMMADTVSSVAIVIGITVIYFTDWYIIDPLLAVMVAAVICKWAYGLLKSSVNILMESSPVDIDEVRAYIGSCEEVEGVHDLHVWEVTHRMYCLTAHVVMKNKDAEKYHALVEEVSRGLREKYKIGHVTLQPEYI